MVRLSAGKQGHRRGLGHVEVRKLQQSHQEVFRTKLLMQYLRGGGQWLFMLLLALWGVRSAHAQSPSDSAFLSILGELREASFPDKVSIVDRLSQTGHPSVRVVLTALMEDRLFYRTAEKPEDQKMVIVKSTEGN